MAAKHLGSVNCLLLLLFTISLTGIEFHIQRKHREPPRSRLELQEVGRASSRICWPSLSNSHPIPHVEHVAPSFLFRDEVDELCSQEERVGKIHLILVCPKAERTSS